MFIIAVYLDFGTVINHIRHSSDFLLCSLSIFLTAEFERQAMKHHM